MNLLFIFILLTRECYKLHGSTTKVNNKVNNLQVMILNINNIIVQNNDYYQN